MAIPEVFQQQIDALIAYLKADPLDGEVLVPGEVEARTRRQRLANGIPLPEATWDELQACAKRFGVAV